ncbi:MAG: hypothetical protein NTW74_23275, partial [Acidobacteria bacterium]|nr:hypothetical protein [Acidobacteriota bacterium]
MHYKELQAGDICLSTTNAVVSNLIRLVTNSSVSHAFLVLGDGNILESIGEGVVIRSFWSVLTEYKLVLAFRHPDITPELANRIIQHAKMIGRPKHVNRINLGMSVASRRPLNVQYDLRGAVGAAIPFVGNDPNA